MRGQHLLEPELDHLRDVAPVVEVRDKEKEADTKFETRDHPANQFFLAHVGIIPNFGGLARAIQIFLQL